MIKNLLVLWFVLSSLSLAVAKDGPFPLQRAVGLWNGEGAPVVVSIQEAGFHTARSVKVIVTIMTRQGTVLATGDTFHSLDSDSLVVPLREKETGRIGAVVMKMFTPSGNYANGHGGEHLRVNLVYEAKGTVPEKNIVLGRNH